MIALLRGVKAKYLEHGHGQSKMDAHIGHSGSWKLKQVLFNSYLKKNWISFKTQIRIDKIRKSLYTGLTNALNFLYVG